MGLFDQERRYNQSLQPGDKVLVLPTNYSKDFGKGAARIFGIGTYLGDSVPPESFEVEVGREGVKIDFDESSGEVVSIEPVGEVDDDSWVHKVTKIRLLHNDEVVYGNECWWVPLESEEGNILNKIIADGKSITIIDIDEQRRKRFNLDDPSRLS